MGVGEYDGETAFIFGDYLQLFLMRSSNNDPARAGAYPSEPYRTERTLSEFEADMYAARRYGVESVIVALAFTLLLTTKRESKDALRKRIRYMKKRRQPEGCFLLP